MKMKLSKIKRFGILPVIACMVVAPTSVVKSDEAMDRIYDEAAVAFFIYSVMEGNDEHIDELNEHGAENVYSMITSAVSQSFYIFVIREGFNEDNNFDKGYRVAIRRMISRIGLLNVEKIIRRGYGLDERGDIFRYGIQFFGDDVPEKEDLELALKQYLELGE